MKHLLFIAFLFIGSFVTVRSDAKHIDVHLTTANGCDVHIVGDVTYTLVPPKITGFKGTVRIGPPCGDITLTFALKGQTVNGEDPDAEIELDNDDPRELTTLTWLHSDSDISAILNDPAVVADLVAILQNTDD